MKCPECNAWTSVLYTKPMSGSRRRRYLCANNHRFWTEEKIIPGPSSTATARTAALQKIEDARKRITKKPKAWEKP